MHIVLLKFAENKGRAADHMAGHNAWLRQGFSDGVFLVAGSLAGGQGGSVIAHGCDRAALEARVAEDPFVAEGVVTAEIVGLSPAVADPRLSFLTDADRAR